MEKTIIASIRIVVFLILVLVIMSSNMIYNQKILSKKCDMLFDTIQDKSFSVRCVPSKISIDQKKEKVVTTLDCEKGNMFTTTGSESGIHFVTGDFSVEVYSGTIAASK